MKKKILCFLLVLTLLMCGTFKIKAKEDSITIKSIEITDKSENVIATTSDFEDLNINMNISLYNLDDYITYKVILKNNSDNDYTIDSVTDTNENEYITYSYNLNNKEFKKGKEIELLVTLKYSKLVDKKIEGLKTKFNIKINYDNGESTVITNNTLDNSKDSNSISEVKENPLTNDNIKTFILVLLVSIVILLILILKNRKMKKIGLLLLMLLMLPTVSALTNSIEINVNVNLNLYKNNTIVFDANGGTGTMNNQIVDDEVYLLKNEYIKDGYVFLSWNTEPDGSGKSYKDEELINIDENITLYAQWKDKRLYNVVKYDAQNDNNAAEYTGEVTDTYDEQGNEKIYYYKGENPNNNVVFGNFCWKMVRTTATGGVKMIYNGVTTDGTCNNTGADTQIGTSVFNTNYNSPAYGGYMYNTVYTFKSGTTTSGSLYGTDVSYANGTYTLTDTSTTKDNDHHYTCNSTSGTCKTVRYYYNGSFYIELNGTENIESALKEMLSNDDVNEKDSTIKSKIDDWYEENMIDYEEYLEDTVFCNDRSISSYGGWNPKGGSLSDYLGFGAYSRDTANLKCTNVTDRFSMSNNKAKLTYPVGLLSIDETLLGRTTSSKWADDNYYLKSGYWWIGSPYDFVNVSALGYYVYPGGGLDYSNVNINGGGVRPAISLKTGTVYSEGDGSVNSPYIVE